MTLPDVQKFNRTKAQQLSKRSNCTDVRNVQNVHKRYHLQPWSNDPMVPSLTLHPPSLKPSVYVCEALWIQVTAVHCSTQQSQPQWYINRLSYLHRSILSRKRPAQNLNQTPCRAKLHCTRTETDHQLREWQQFKNLYLHTF